MTPFSLEGRTALVTGANTGIGQAIAVALAQAGADVIASGLRDCAETVAMMMQVPTRRAVADPGFRADPMAARDVFAAQPIDILVNNAGIIRRDDAVDFTEADWDAVLDVNAKALFFTRQAFARAACHGKGQIVTSRRCCPFRAASACRPIPPRNMAWRG